MNGSRTWDVLVVGPGRLGTLLAVTLARTPHRVTAVAGGSPESRQRLAHHLDGAGGAAVRLVEDPVEVAGEVDLMLLTTPDDVIAEVVTGLAVADALKAAHRVVHTSGAHGLAPLERAALAGAGVAACHPAQTVPAGPPEPDALRGAAWAVTAPPGDRDWAEALVESLGGRPHRVRDEDRVLYHAGLAVGSNAVGAAVALARQLLLAARIGDPRDFLDPLVVASVDNVLEEGAVALTGPVVRGDVGTVARHLAALEADVPELVGVYRALTSAVLDQVRPRLDAEVADRLQELLRGVRGG